MCTMGTKAHATSVAAASAKRSSSFLPNDRMVVFMAAILGRGASRIPSPHQQDHCHLRQRVRKDDDLGRLTAVSRLKIGAHALMMEMGDDRGEGR